MEGEEKTAERVRLAGAGLLARFCLRKRINALDIRRSGGYNNGRRALL